MIFLYCLITGIIVLVLNIIINCGRFCELEAKIESRKPAVIDYPHDYLAVKNIINKIIDEPLLGNKLVEYIKFESMDKGEKIEFLKIKIADLRKSLCSGGDIEDINKLTLKLANLL